MNVNEGYKPLMGTYRQIIHLVNVIHEWAYCGLKWMAEFYGLTIVCGR